MRAAGGTRARAFQTRRVPATPSGILHFSVIEERSVSFMLPIVYAISLSATGLGSADPTGMLAGVLSAVSAALNMIPGVSASLS